MCSHILCNGAIQVKIKFNIYGFMNNEFNNSVVSELRQKLNELQTFWKNNEKLSQPQVYFPYCEHKIKVPSCGKYLWR